MKVTSGGFIALTFLVNSSFAGRLIQRDIGTAAIIGTFSDANCQNGQTDLSDTVKDHWGTCRNLGGNSLKVWWLAKGCEVLTFNRNRECGTTPRIITDWNTCIDTTNDWSWWVYCI